MLRFGKFRGAHPLAHAPAVATLSSTNVADPIQSNLLEHLAGQFPTAKRQTLRRMIAEERVTVNGRTARKATEIVKAGDTVRVVAPRVSDPALLILPLEIIFEDADILVVAKPAGLLTSTVPNEKRPTALALVRRYVSASQPRAQVGLIHRLDRDASGLLIFSKSHAAYESLKSQFFKHTVERVYEAVVHGWPDPPKGRMASDLVERADGTVRSTRRRGHGQHAVTRYEVIERSDKSIKPRTSRLRVELETGRKHQIRVHLSERGWPIVGDTVYAGKEDDADAQSDGSKRSKKRDKKRANQNLIISNTTPADEGELRLSAVLLKIAHPITGEPQTFHLSPKPLPVDKKHID